MGSKLKSGSRLAAAPGPEDLRAGDYVARLYEVSYYPRIARVLNEFTSGDIGTIQWSQPAKDAAPMRIASVCLPFVLARGVDGKYVTLDVRKDRLARLSPRFGKKAFARLKPKEGESKAPVDKDADS